MPTEKKGRLERGFVWLFVFIPLSYCFGFLTDNLTATFITAILAIVPLARTIGYATKEITLQTNPAFGGLVNATFGNIIELIIAFLAIQRGLRSVVQASIIGSIIGNILLLTGLSIFCGGIRYKGQTFNKESVGVSSTRAFPPRSSAGIRSLRARATWREELIGQGVDGGGCSPPPFRSLPQASGPGWASSPRRAPRPRRASGVPSKPAGRHRIRIEAAGVVHLDVERRRVAFLPRLVVRVHDRWPRSEDARNAGTKGDRELHAFPDRFRPVEIQVAVLRFPEADLLLEGVHLRGVDLKPRGQADSRHHLG